MIRMKDLLENYETDIDSLQDDINVVKNGCLKMEEELRDEIDRVSQNENHTAKLARAEFNATVDCLLQHKEAIDRVEERVADLEAHRLVHHGELVLANKRITALEAKLATPPLVTPRCVIKEAVERAHCPGDIETFHPSPLVGRRCIYQPGNSNVPGTIIDRPNCNRYPLRSKVTGRCFVYWVRDRDNKVLGSYRENLYVVGIDTPTACD